MQSLLDIEDPIQKELESFEQNFRTRFSAIAIDETAGIVRGCTAAQAGVQAAGKFVLLDKTGALTRDPLKAVRKLPVYTDEKSLETLLLAVEKAGGILKVRSDHDDTIAARAGTAQNWRLVEDGEVKRVAVDLHLLKAYRDREIFLETAKTAPALVGLSIDFLPVYEILPDRALMRVAEVNAVDIVDEGAITRDGLFLSRKVDKRAKFAKAPSETQNHPPMADKPESKEPTLSEVLNQVSALAAGVKSCMDGLAAMQAKLAAAPASPEEKKKEEVPAEMSAGLKQLNETLAAAKAERDALAADRAKFAQERTALGLKGAPASAAETEAEKLAAEKAKQEGEKTYLQLVDEAKASGKFKKGSEAHTFVMKAHPEKYAAHLRAQGIYDPSRDRAAAR